MADKEKVKAKGTGSKVPPYCTTGDIALDRESCEFYRNVLKLMKQAEIPFMLGGAHAFHNYTGIARDTKDLDLFLCGADVVRALSVLAEAGYNGEVVSTVWLAKAYYKDLFADLIFNSGNATSPVDDEWFAHAVDGEVLGLPVKVVPVEEIIWQKAYILNRFRADVADVAHLIWARGKGMDWKRLLGRFGEHWRVLFSHLILFGFIYPSERESVPEWVMKELVERLQNEMENGPGEEHVCYGTLFSKDQYQIDIEKWGYEDARLKPRGNMTMEETTQ